MADDESRVGELLPRPASSGNEPIGRPAIEFDEWVQSNADRLFRFAFVITANQAAAEEILQSTLAKAYEKWARISSVDDPAAYVRRMIVNAHLSWWRRIGRREARSGSADQLIDVVDLTTPDFTEQLSRSELVWRCCMDLPPMQRVAIVLRFYEDLTYAEIAGVMKCPEPTARSRVHRGLVALRLAIEDEEDRDE